MKAQWKVQEHSISRNRVYLKQVDTGNRRVMLNYGGGNNTLIFTEITSAVADRITRSFCKEKGSRSSMLCCPSKYYLLISLLQHGAWLWQLLGFFSALLLAVSARIILNWLLHGKVSCLLWNRSVILGHDVT